MQYSTAMEDSRTNEQGGKWTWEPADVEATLGERLRYEPGNWGDLLKGVWAAAIVEHLLQGADKFFYLDPYSGAPDYPLTDAAARRLEAVSASLLGDLRASRARSERTGLGVLCGPAPESRRFERSKTPSAA